MEIEKNISIKNSSDEIETIKSSLQETFKNSFNIQVNKYENRILLLEEERKRLEVEVINLEKTVAESFDNDKTSNLWGGMNGTPYKQLFPNSDVESGQFDDDNDKKSALSSWSPLLIQFANSRLCVSSTSSLHLFIQKLGLEKFIYSTRLRLILSSTMYLVFLHILLFYKYFF
jgi:hypothetical protein